MYGVVVGDLRVRIRLVLVRFSSVIERIPLATHVFSNRLPVVLVEIIAGRSVRASENFKSLAAATCPTFPTRHHILFLWHPPQGFQKDGHLTGRISSKIKGHSQLSTAGVPLNVVTSVGGACWSCWFPPTSISCKVSTICAKHCRSLDVADQYLMCTNKHQTHGISTDTDTLGSRG